MKPVTLLLLILISGQIQVHSPDSLIDSNNQDALCVFSNYADCLSNARCCRVYLNEEFLCLAKSVLVNDYKKMLAANFGDADQRQIEKLEVVDGGEDLDFCPKWTEANDTFFADTTLKYSCECYKHEGIVAVGIAMIVGLALAF